jgi:DNA-directed RNA polymerase beta subunit
MGYYLSVRNSEGASVGLVKNMAMMSSITISSNSSNIREVIKDLGTVNIFT